MKVNTTWDAAPSTCNHWPPMLAMIPTGHGYKARCMTCGQVGPERDTTSPAWAALLNLRRQPGTDEASATAAPRPRVKGNPGGRR